MEADEKKLAIRLFSGFANKLSKSLKHMEPYLEKSGIRMLLRTYISLALLYSSFSLFFSFLFSLVLLSFVMPFLRALAVSFFVSIVFFLTALGASYLYPFYRTEKRAKKIEASLPFAINHMAAVASSGAPPYMVFKMLANFSEYGEISKEAGIILNHVEGLGIDLAESIKNRIKQTPSNDFREFLQGMLAALESGGDLRSYMEVQSKDAIFRYRIEREKYMDSLSTYAELYTAVLVVAPLFLIALLAIISSVGGTLGNIPIEPMVAIGVYLIIPLANALFLAAVHITQPEQV